MRDQQDALVALGGDRLTPADTTLSASMSRPESVSSRTATLGFNSSNWSDLVALLLAAGEAFVDAPLRERWIEVEA